LPIILIPIINKTNCGAEKNQKNQLRQKGGTIKENNSLVN
jgi:hypothetical protein